MGHADDETRQEAMTEGQDPENTTPRSRSLEPDTSDRDGPAVPQAANDPAPAAESAKKTSRRRTRAQDGEGGQARPSRNDRPGAKPKSKPRPYNLIRTDFPGIMTFRCTKHMRHCFKFTWREGVRQRSKYIHGSLKEAKNARDEALSSRRRPVPGEYQTFGEVVRAHLALTRARVEDATLEGYQICWRLVEDRLADLPIEGLDPAEVQMAIVDLLEASDRRKPISLSTAYHIRALLRSATGKAAARRKIPYDPLPASSIDLPALRSPTTPYLTGQELLRAWDLLEADPAARRILAVCGFAGLRRSEAAALWWENVDPPFEVCRRVLNRPEPQPSGVRVLHVGHTLRRHDGVWVRTEVMKTPWSERLAWILPTVDSALAGPHEVGDWVLSASHPVFNRGDHMRNIWERANRTLAAGGLPLVTIRGLRHSAGTLMIDAGVHQWVAHRILGHRLPGMGTTYIHPTWEQLVRAQHDVEEYLARLRDR
jgi:integrase